MSNQTNIIGPSRDELISIWNGEITVRVRIAGEGPAIVYFHPAGGLYWDEFLDALAENHTVYAPELPGTTPGDPYAIHKVASYNELLLMYEEVLRKLELNQPVGIGQSMGGMVTLDLAASYRNLFSKVVALAPTGLWREDAPIGIADLYAAPPEEVPDFLFNNPSLPSAQAMFAMPEDPEDIPAHIAQNVWALGCAGKFLWPIPDHGLNKRMHRICAPTLVLWGQQDQLLSPTYADEFAAGIPNCAVEVFEDCGHILQVDQLSQAVEQVGQFIN